MLSNSNVQPAYSVSCIQSDSLLLTIVGPYILNILVYTIHNNHECTYTQAYFSMQEILFLSTWLYTWHKRLSFPVHIQSCKLKINCKSANILVELIPNFTSNESTTDRLFADIGMNWWNMKCLTRSGLIRMCSQIQCEKHQKVEAMNYYNVYT